MKTVLDIDITKETRDIDPLAPRLIGGAGVVGALGLGATLLLSLISEASAHRVFHSYLVSFCIFLSLALGALFFVIIQHLTHAGWSVTVRRLAEATAMTLPVFLVLIVPVLLGRHHLYHWMDPQAVAHDNLLQVKQPYLNMPFFMIRLAIYFLVWSGLSAFYFSRSVRQDESKDPALTSRMEGFAGPAVILFAVTVTFASFDLLMSLEPHWYSTIFGVYFFAGSVVGFFSLLTVFAYLLQRMGRLTTCVTVEHYHDLGKLVFAFVVFWAYIGFSQYMLIWYGDIPEETMWYAARQEGSWVWISLLLLFGHFVIPFLYLISRRAKRRVRILVPGALWVLLMHCIDMYWIVIPQVSPGNAMPHLVDLTSLVGIGGIFLAAIVYVLKGRSLLAIGDPRLEESLMFENA